MYRKKKMILNFKNSFYRYRTLKKNNNKYLKI